MCNKDVQLEQTEQKKQCGLRETAGNLVGGRERIKKAGTLCMLSVWTINALRETQAAARSNTNVPAMPKPQSQLHVVSVDCVSSTGHFHSVLSVYASDLDEIYNRLFTDPDFICSNQMLESPTAL